MLIVYLGIDIHIALTIGIGIVHDVNHSLFDGQVNLHRCAHVEACSLAHLIYKCIELGHFLHIVRQCKMILVTHVELLFSVLKYDLYHLIDDGMRRNCLLKIGISVES